MKHATLTFLKMHFLWDSLSVNQKWNFPLSQCYKIQMARRRLSEALRWQIIGMHATGMSFKAIGRQLGYCHSVISRLIRKHQTTGHVKDLPRSGQPKKTTPRNDCNLARLVRREPLPHTPLSTRTVRRRLWALGLKPRRVIKRTALSDNHKRLRLQWYLAR